MGTSSSLRFVACALVGAVLAGCGDDVLVPDTVALLLLSPNGGETCECGTPVPVTWETENYSGNVDIECSTDGGATWVLLVADTPNDGLEDVVAPSVASSTARMQVSAADGDPTVTGEPADQSDGDFELVARIVVTSPNGGEGWEIEATVTVTWDPWGYTGSVDLDVSLDGGATWSLLVADTTNDGSEDVTVPRTPCHEARVQVSAADGDPSVALAPSDRSDADHRIGGPPYDIGAGLPGIEYCPLAWGDYDNDGDLDLALAGDTGSDGFSRVYRNEGGTFTDVGAALPGMRGWLLAWGDYDNDGDLDLALVGSTVSGPTSRIYRNEEGTFADIDAGLPSMVACSLAWGDYDNDGDLDLALAGSTGSEWITGIYENDEGTFADIDAGLPGVTYGSLAWGDYDNDGDVDLALAGNADSGRISRIYENDGGTFTDVDAGLTGVSHGSLAWGDFDNDGDLDLALAGLTLSDPISRIYESDGGMFTDVSTGVEGVEYCSLAWGDFDNDGDLDLALAGMAFWGDPISQIYENAGGMFLYVAAGLPGVAYCSLAWGDYDNDGDLDLALAGNTGSDPISRIYRNDGGFRPNTPPSAPSNGTASQVSEATVITWDAANDVETPAEGLSYNLRIGQTTTGDGDYPSMADALGWRRVPALGPITHELGGLGTGSAWVDLPPGIYYVSVQAVDTSFAGSPWSDPILITVP